MLEFLALQHQPRRRQPPLTALRYETYFSKEANKVLTCNCNEVLESDIIVIPTSIACL